MNEDKRCIIERLEKTVGRESLLTAMTAFFDVWNMDCPNCATWVHNSLLQLDGVLRVDVFFQQGVAVVTYDPKKIAINNLTQAVVKAGSEVCHYYGIELIGQSPTTQALRL